MREFKFINFNKGKNYYLIEINRPDQLNAINKETIEELKDCFLSIKNSTKGFYGVIITGSGDKSFVAGADISEFKGLNEKTAKELSLNGHELFHIIENFSRLINLNLEDESSYSLAKISRGTPRIALRLLRRVRDYAQVVVKTNFISANLIKNALNSYQIDEKLSLIHI